MYYFLADIVNVIQKYWTQNSEVKWIPLVSACQSSTTCGSLKKKVNKEKGNKNECKSEKECEISLACYKIYITLHVPIPRI
jgi:hypothetical protein